MLFLLLAIGSSALISILMRLSAEKTSGGVGMLAMNYLMCAALSAFYAGGSGSFFPQSASLGQTVGLGAVIGRGCIIDSGATINKNAGVPDWTWVDCGEVVHV